jgi:hypothetical protein
VSNEWRASPRELRPSTTEGDTLQTIDGVAAWGTAPSGLDDIVVSVTNGVPYVMFDADGTVVTEG